MERNQDIITFTTEDGDEVKFHVIEETRINGRDYLLVLDDIEDEGGVAGEVLHEIQYSDVDYNRHCNSCKYLEWMVNAQQAYDNQKPFRLDINYVKELYQGDKMWTRFLKTSDAVQYQQVDENGTTCCSAKISQIENVSC